jgi:hypothetical protein
LARGLEAPPRPPAALRLPLDFAVWRRIKVPTSITNATKNATAKTPAASGGDWLYIATPATTPMTGTAHPSRRVIGTPLDFSPLSVFAPLSDALPLSLLGFGSVGSGSAASANAVGRLAESL